MNTIININQNHVAPLTAFYKSRKQELLAELNDVDSVLAQLSGAEPGIKIENHYGYSHSLTWINKVKYILNANGGELTPFEIVDKLLLVDPEYAQDRKSVAASVSATLSVHSKEGGHFTKRKEDGKIYYGINNKGAE